jgi:hypothetical protein
MRRAAVVAAAGLVALAGCSSASSASAPPAAARRTASLAPPPAVPTLGHAAGIFARGAGFGQVRPYKIFNGGDPTGLVTRIAWSSWGGATATGTGTGVYVAPGQSVAQGRQQRVTVVAFRLGSCHGTRMYRAVEWYFPQHGQSFSARRYEDICAGSYVPAP